MDIRLILKVVVAVVSFGGLIIMHTFWKNPAEKIVEQEAETIIKVDTGINVSPLFKDSDGNNK